MGRTDPRRLDRLAWLFALAVAVVPFWVTRDLPLVDLPQHNYVIAVLGQLDDPDTLYPAQFERRPGLRPYIGYYAVAGLLARVVSIETANRIFLTGLVIALPLAMAFLLRSLGRRTWPALLTIPFAFGDTLAWGFMNYCAAFPVMVLGLGAWVRAIADPPRRLAWSLGLIACLAAMLAFHPGPAFYLAPALPFLLLTTRAPEDRPGQGLVAWLAPRRLPLAVLALCAAAGGILAAGVAMRSRTVAAAVARGDWIGLLMQRHYEFRPPGESMRLLPDLLANFMRDGSDRIGLFAVAAVGLAAVVVSRFDRGAAPGHAGTGIERVRPAGLVAIGLGLYLALPLHIYGLVGLMSPRFAPVAAAMAAGLVPALGERSRRAFVWLAALAALGTAVPMVLGFRAFDREAAALRRIEAAVGPRPTVMGLVFDYDSRVVRHPVYLHAAASMARAGGGIPNHSLATWSVSPIRHRVAPPPSYEDEWRPDLYDDATMGPAYDHFLGRGREPGAVFGGRLGRELVVAAREGDWWLVRRR